jgi:hypothetical protein
MWKAVAFKRPIYANDDLPGDAPMDVFSTRMSVLGTLLHGETSGLVGYIYPPRYRAFKFAAAEHDRFDIWVASEDGDAVAWVLDTNFQALAWNDDAGKGTTDAYIGLTIPSSQPVFYIVFREYNLAFSHFRVRLKWRGRDATAPVSGSSSRSSTLEL